MDLNPDFRTQLEEVSREGEQRTFRPLPAGAYRLSIQASGGVTKYVTEIRLRELVMLGGREEPERQPVASEAKTRKRGSREQVSAGRSSSGYDDFQPPPVGNPDDDLPF